MRNFARDENGEALHDDTNEQRKPCSSTSKLYEAVARQARSHEMAREPLARSLQWLPEFQTSTNGCKKTWNGKARRANSLKLALQQSQACHS